VLKTLIEHADADGGTPLPRLPSSYSLNFGLVLASVLE
jgi:hypothetical protein